MIQVLLLMGRTNYSYLCQSDEKNEQVSNCWVTVEEGTEVYKGMTAEEEIV